MNRVFLKKNGEEEKIFVVRDSAKREHLLHHLKVDIGSTIKVAIENQGLGLARVTHCSNNEIFLEVEKLGPAQPQPYTLLVASSRPPTMKKILEHGSSLGVSEFILFPGELSEKSYLTSKIYEEEALEQLLTLGIEQGGQFATIPTVRRVNSLSEAMKAAKGAKFLLSLESKKTWERKDFENETHLTLAIGPERGWTQKEEEKLIKENFSPIKISSATLRVEMATFVALGQLEYLFKNRL